MTPQGNETTLVEILELLDTIIIDTIDTNEGERAILLGKGVFNIGAGSKERSHFPQREHKITNYHIFKINTIYI